MSTKLQTLKKLYKKSIIAHKKAYSRNHDKSPSKMTKHFKTVVKSREALERHKMELLIAKEQNNHNKHYNMATKSTTPKSYHNHMKQAGNAAQRIAKIQNKINAL